MKDLSAFGKIYLAIKPVDFRKQAHGLALIVEHAFQLNIMSEKVIFAFTNKRKSAIKLLYWDKTGYALWWKILEKERFKWPKNSQEVVPLSPREIKWLLDGVDLSKVKTHQIIRLE